MPNDVLLGYLEDPKNKILLTSTFFPSKFGGKPAWLDPKYLPSQNDLQCSSCGFRLRFLLQIYAPLDDRDDLFHRTLFVFICINCSQSAQVYRCQLPRKNDYYDFNPVEMNLTNKFFDERLRELELNLNDSNHKILLTVLCDICGMPLTQENTHCHESCKHINSNENELVFPEYNLEIDICSTDEEKEDDYDQEDEDDGENEQKQEINVDKCIGLESENNIDIESPNKKSFEKNESAKISSELSYNERHKDESSQFEKIDTGNINPSSKEYSLLKNYEKKLREDIDNVLDDSEMKAFKEISAVSSENKDAEFDKFLSMSLKYKGHVVRYCYNGNPLWISERYKLSGLPPKCQNCNGERVFEFQVQPETIVLGKIQNNAVNFGILAIYTCSNNCKPNNFSNSHYIQEFIYVQNNPY
ncbi:hypothetical protein FG386_001539 [Cryptosporidium ryanae]|uniref:uncharacterized protein n=1 Tax=Cryptosporidium ryanae TaxID=515981 RepID=UPI003519F0DC|nr:hypothetical protein FG386_001539 [Cryptosporidium ryanae]